MNKIIIKPIYVKPDSYFYNYYNNYIKQSQNCESDQFILNLLICKNKLYTPPYYFKYDIINNLNNYNHNTKNNYYLQITENIKNNKIQCSICYENLSDNYILTPCMHAYCYKCFNCINDNINNNNNNNIDIINNQVCSENKFKCSICSSKYNTNSLQLINNNNNSIIEILMQLYEPKKKILNKDFIYKFLGYKAYHIMKLIHKNKYPFNIKNISKTKIVIIDSNKNWIHFMKSLHPNFIFFESIDLFYTNKCNENIKDSKIEQYNIYLTNNNIIVNYNKKILKILKNKKLNYYQFVIKNTIDEKIFKGKVIIKI